MPKPLETVELTINSETFSDWETIWVRQEWGEQFRTFRFTASEDSPPRTWIQTRITPGDYCDVRLAGLPAIHGWVFERQVYADANRHQVMIAGQSRIGDITRTTIYKPQEFKGYSFQSIASSLLQPYGFEFFPKNGVDSSPFKDVTVWIGEKPWNVLARLAAHRGVILGDDETGTRLVGVTINDNAMSGAMAGTLTEGQNIISMRCTVIDHELVHPVAFHAQESGDDNSFGSAVSENYVELDGMLTSPDLAGRGRYRPWASVAEYGANKHDLLMRTKFEIAWREREAITAQIWVHGWVNDIGGLWQAMDRVRVVAPMLAMNQSLIIQAVTFTQDNSTGSRTLLELCNWQALQWGGVVPMTSDFGPGNPGTPGPGAGPPIRN